MVERAVILSGDDYLKLDHFLPIDSGRRMEQDISQTDMESLIDIRIQVALEKFINGNQTTFAVDVLGAFFVGPS